MGVRMAEGFYVTCDAWCMNFTKKVSMICELMYQSEVWLASWNVCEMWPVKFFPLWKNIKISLTPCTQEDRFEVFLSHIWSPNFQDPTLLCYTLEWHLKSWFLYLFFNDIDTKQLEGKCTFDAMYEKLLNMQFGKHSFQNLLFNCCLWLKRIWHPKFF